MKKPATAGLGGPNKQRAGHSRLRNRPTGAPDDAGRADPIAEGVGAADAGRAHPVAEIVSPNNARLADAIAKLVDTGDLLLGDGAGRRGREAERLRTTAARGVDSA